MEFATVIIQLLILIHHKVLKCKCHTVMVMMPPLAYNVIKVHKSRTVKVKLLKIELKPSLEVPVISICIHISLNLVETNLRNFSICERG